MTYFSANQTYVWVIVLPSAWDPQGTELVNLPSLTAWVEFTLVWVLLTYLCPSLPVEHRPSTTPRHRTLFWAALVIADQLVPCCFSSASVSRLQLLRGRPLFLFPCGFQVRAWRVVLDAGFLWVCPIQPHFLRSICLATGSCPARSHSSSFQSILRMHLHVYVSTWSDSQMPPLCSVTKPVTSLKCGSTLSRVVKKP